MPAFPEGTRRAAPARAADRGATIRAGAQPFDAADEADEVFDAADQACETAVAGYRSAQAAAGAAAVTCANGYPCTDNRLDRFRGPGRRAGRAPAADGGRLAGQRRVRRGGRGGRG